ncbi:MAG: Eco57I restriction-modification methylase domain-containing protein [Candidatus Nanohaloarchaea archaeon]
MALGTITKADIRSWNSIDDIADTLEKRGFERTDLGEEGEIVMEIDDDEFLAIIRADSDKTASDYRKRMNARRHTQVVSTEDFREFTFTTRRRSWDKHGRIRYQRYKIQKSMFEEGGAGRSALDKLNQLEHGKPETINQMYDTKKVVSEFYDQFEKIRAKMVQNVANLPDDAGEEKRNYAQTVFDRLIFLHFIQEKKLLDYKQDYLERHHNETIEDGGDVYEDFYRPLFFDWLSSDTERGPGTLPYLNGGLFTRTDVEREYPDIRLGETTKETNRLFTEILEFLGDWNWHADERLDIVDPNRLSPELLGHIFEKTVNQKEMGAYYTPEEITNFMSRNTIHPYVIDRINEKFDTDYEEIDEVFAVDEGTEAQEGETTVIGNLDDINQEEITYLYFEVLQNLKVLDPAVGSGAFLLAAEEILLDIYLSCITYFQRLARQQGHEMTRQITDLVEELEANVANPSMHAKRQIILNNLYGVDIDKGATEICKLRLWLSIVADLEKGDDPHEVEALPNIDFNIRQGNSLIGFTEPVEKALNDDLEKETAQANLNQYSPDAIHKRYQEIINKIKTYKRHEKEGNGQKAEQARKKVFQKLEEHREEPDKKILQQFKEAGIDVELSDVKNFSPFHWVLEFAEVYSQGGFDVIIGNPPWDKVKAERTDFFPRYDELFRAREDEEKDQKQKELLQEEEIAEEWEKYQEEITKLKDYYKKCPHYSLQSSKVAGNTLSGDQELSTMFLERMFNICSDSGYVSAIFPAILFSGGSNKSLRNELFNNKTLHSTIGFENKGIFDGVDNRKKFGITTFKNSGETESFEAVFMLHNPEKLTKYSNITTKLRPSIVREFSPEANSFPFITSRNHLNVIKKLINPSQLREDIEGAWRAIPYVELHRSNDRDRFVDKKDGDYPVYSGKNIYQYKYDYSEPKFWSVEEPDSKSAKQRIREKNFRSRNPEISLKKKIYAKFGGNGNQKKFVDGLLKDKRGKELTIDDILLDCREYRVVLRSATSPTNERSLLAACIPPGIVCHNGLKTIRPYVLNIEESDLEEFPLHNVYERAFTDKELFAFLGLINSIPFDYLIRAKVEETVNLFHFSGTQCPRLTEGDEWFDYISRRSAKLNCYGKEFEEMRSRFEDLNPVTEEDKRKKIRAEIDAAAFHAYELNESEVEFVLEDFHQVKDPELMTDAYLASVDNKFKELKERKQRD